MSRLFGNSNEIHRLHNMADKKDEAKEKQEKETKKTEDKEPELVCQYSCCSLNIVNFYMELLIVFSTLQNLEIFIQFCPVML